jgi:hypothetical protein
MRKRLTWCLAIAFVGVFAAAVNPSPALAADSNAVERQIGYLLGAHPGAKRIDTYSVEVRDGVLITVPAPKSSGITPTANCAYYWLCLWSEYGLVGPRIAFTKCGLGVQNIGNLAYPHGGTWSDKVSSIMNNQTPGTWSSFYDWYVGGGWDYLKSLRAYGYLYNLANDRADDGSHMNDRIDGIHVC